MSSDYYIGYYKHGIFPSLQKVRWEYIAVVGRACSGPDTFRYMKSPIFRPGLQAVGVRSEYCLALNFKGKKRDGKILSAGFLVSLKLHVIVIKKKKKVPAVCQI